MAKITVYKIYGKTKDGREFQMWETTDTKDKTRMCVRFVTGTEEPETTTTIELVNAWVDKRKKYPILRVKEYNVVEVKKPSNNVDEFFN